VRGGLTRRMIVASGLLGIMVSAAFAGLLVSVADLRGAAQSARHSEQVLMAANRLERLDREAGERGFLITGQEDRLRLWRTSQTALPGQASHLESLVADGLGAVGRGQVDLAERRLLRPGLLDPVGRGCQASPRLRPHRGGDRRRCGPHRRAAGRVRSLHR